MEELPFAPILLEGDNKMTVKLINDNNLHIPWRIQKIISDSRQLANHMPQVSISIVPREQQNSPQHGDYSFQGTSFS